jgi:hypothetical protein
MAATPLSIIKEKVLAYHKRMNAIVNFLSTQNAPSNINNTDKHQEHLGFYIDKKALKRLNQIMALKNCNSLAVMFGIGEADNPTQMTACVFGVDENRNILTQHKMNQNKSSRLDKDTPPVDGEDTWPPPNDGLQLNVTQGNNYSSNYFTLATARKELSAYFE